MYGSWVQSLVHEDSTKQEATKPVHHNHWAHTPEVTSRNYWSPYSTREVTAMRSLHTAAREYPPLTPTREKPEHTNEGPAQQNINKFWKGYKETFQGLCTRTALYHFIWASWAPWISVSTCILEPIPCKYLEMTVHYHNYGGGFMGVRICQDFSNGTFYMCAILSHVKHISINLNPWFKSPTWFWGLKERGTQ